LRSIDKLEQGVGGSRYPRLRELTACLLQNARSLRQVLSMPAYTKAELDGKTVELEMPDRTTRFGIFRVRHDSTRLSIQVECYCPRTGEKEAIESGTPDRKYLRKHPRPERAEFLWAQHIG
jgi:hypothetical protein